MNAGVNVGEDKLCVLLYADDVVVMSESAEELHSLLDVVGEYGKDFEVKFSSEKSKVMINKSDEERNATWKLDGKDLQQACENKYLGMWLSQDGCNRAKN